MMSQKEWLALKDTILLVWQRLIGAYDQLFHENFGLWVTSSLTTEHLMQVEPNFCPFVNGNHYPGLNTAELSYRTGKGIVVIINPRPSADLQFKITKAILYVFKSFIT